MLKIFIWKNLSAAEKNKILQRPAAPNAGALQKTQDIINQVRTQSDKALKQLTHLYDKVSLENLAVGAAEFTQAERITVQAKKAIEQAAQQIYNFHYAQMPKNIAVETIAGVNCELQFRAIEKVGFYIPGGTASLPSTVLMLGIPAKIAGCSERVLCSPPRADGSMDPHVLYAAKVCGIEKAYKIGGAQAIAAMAFGTETVTKVNKIFGPGNSWVTQAKLLVAQDPQGASYDLPAGPTEQMLIADELANPEFVAADLLSQAEHGNDSQVILICNNATFAERVNQALEKQLQTLPRKEIAEQALQNSCTLLVENFSEAIAIANDYAPEHLILQLTNPRQYMAKIRCAGSVFIGPWSAESVGDYASGTNHVLPTFGYGRSFSGLSLNDFMQRVTFQELTAAGLQKIGHTVETLATIEGLEAHRRAVTIRLASDCMPKNVSDIEKHSLTQLARPEIIAMIPYSSARSETMQGNVWLNANENPWNDAEYFNRYPQPQPAELITKLSNLYKVSPQNILATRGSDEVIDLLLRVFCRAGQDAILLTPPTYGMYKVSATIQGAEIIEVPLKNENYTLDVETILKVWQPSIKLIFLCSPNNPTGNLLEKEKILRLCRTLMNKALIVVDEAYVEFANTQSLANEITRYPNLVILRTLSKAFGLAGVRCGTVIAEPIIIELLKRVLAPYPIPRPISKIICDAINEDTIKDMRLVVENIIQQREWLISQLKMLSFVEYIWPSLANFILFRVNNAQKILNYCAEQGIILRSREKDYGLENCIRMTVGTPQENQLTIEVLKHVETQNFVY